MTVKRLFCAVFACFFLFGGVCFAAAPHISNQTSLDALGRAAEEGDYVFFNFKSAAFADPDGDTVRYWAEAGGLNITSGAGSGYWLTFLGGTRTFYGTVPAGYAGQNIYVTVHAYDDSLPDDTDAVYTFVISVTDAQNATPHISNQTSLDALGRTAGEGDYLFFSFSSTAFKDADGDTLYYRAEVGGQDISSGYWLRFLAGTRTFFGTVPAGYAGQNISVTVHAYDDPLPDDTDAVYTFVISVTGESVITDVTCTYDDLNRLTGAEYGDGSHIEYFYDSAGNRTQKICYAP